MALAAFTRLTDRILAHLGEPAMLRGEAVEPPILVNIEHGVDVAGEYGEVVMQRSVATIDLRHAPTAGDALNMLALQPDGSWAVATQYVLEPFTAHNGYAGRFILRKV
jgi:hypothetical protein